MEWFSNIQETPVFPSGIAAPRRRNPGEKWSRVQSRTRAYFENFSISRWISDPDQMNSRIGWELIVIGTVRSYPYPVHRTPTDDPISAKFFNIESWIWSMKRRKRRRMKKIRRVLRKTLKDTKHSEATNAERERAKSERKEKLDHQQSSIQNQCWSWRHEYEGFQFSF